MAIMEMRESGWIDYDIKNMYTIDTTKRNNPRLIRAGFPKVSPIKHLIIRVIREIRVRK